MRSISGRNVYVLKYKIRLPHLNLCTLFKTDYVFRTYFRPFLKIVYCELLQHFSEHVNIKRYPILYKYRSYYTAGIHKYLLSVNRNCVKEFITIYIVNITINIAAYNNIF